MKIKTLLIVWGVVAVLTVATALMVLLHQTAQPTLQLTFKADDRTRPAPVRVEPPVPDPLPPERISPPVRTAGPDNAKTQAVLVTPPLRPDPRLNDPVYKEQLGRYALNYVGADPDADEVWGALIYDSSLSEKVREDLMEDLNENGFSGGDGSIATAEDLPLIESRIELLQEHMTDADPFMLEHLAEAYKDLVNMWVRLNGQ